MLVASQIQPMNDQDRQNLGELVMALVQIDDLVIEWVERSRNLYSSSVAAGDLEAFKALQNNCLSAGYEDATNMKRYVESIQRYRKFWDNALLAIARWFFSRRTDGRKKDPEIEFWREQCRATRRRHPHWSFQLLPCLRRSPLVRSRTSFPPWTTSCMRVEIDPIARFLPS